METEAKLPGEGPGVCRTRTPENTCGNTVGSKETDLDRSGSKQKKADAALPLVILPNQVLFTPAETPVRSERPLFHRMPAEVSVICVWRSYDMISGPEQPFGQYQLFLEKESGGIEPSRCSKRLCRCEKTGPAKGVDRRTGEEKARRQKALLLHPLNRAAEYASKQRQVARTP